LPLDICPLAFHQLSPPTPAPQVEWFLLGQAKLKAEGTAAKELVEASSQSPSQDKLASDLRLKSLILQVMTRS